MKLPTIVMLERHWDVLAKETLLQALPMLSGHGYDALCVELPNDYSQENTIKTLDSTIDHIENTLLRQTKPYLEKQNVDIKQLSDMHYDHLQSFLHNYVSTTHFKELAAAFKELPAHKLMKTIFGKILDLKGSIHGVDLNKDKYFSFNDPMNLSHKISSIRKNETDRIACFNEYLLSLQNQGKGIIFVVGKHHFSGLLKAYKDEERLKEVIFLHPHSEKKYASNVEDRLLNIEPNSLTAEVTCLDRRLYSPEQIPDYVNALNQLLISKLKNYYREVPEHPITTHLSQSLGLEFSAHQRPSFFIDGVHKIQENEDGGQIVKQLNQLGIFSTLKTVHGDKYLTIPNLNTSEVSQAVSNLDSTSPH